MLRDFILTQKTKRNLRNRVDPLTIRYDSAEHIGILFDMKDFDYEVVKQMKSIFSQDEIDVSVIGYTPKMNDPVIHDTVIKREITFSGAIKSSEFEKFNRNKYDFLILMCYEPDSTYNFLVTNCKASCKVGLYTDDGQSPIADFQIKTSKGSEVEELTKYLKMIK